MAAKDDNDLSSFIGFTESTEAPKAQAPAQAPPAAPEKLSEGSATAVVAPGGAAPSAAPSIPNELAQLAATVGFSQREIDSYEGDAKALTRSIHHILRMAPEAAAPKQAAPVQEKPPEPGAPWNAKEFTEELYDTGIIGLAKQVESISKVLSKIDRIDVLEKLNLDKLIPQLEQDMQERRNERGRAIFEKAITDAGFDAAILRDHSTEAKLLGMVTSLTSAIRDSGEPIPALDTIMKSVLPLVGAASAKPPAAAQSPGQSEPQTQQQARQQQQQQVLDRARNQMNGRFTAEPAHRGGAPGDGSPLRSILLDHGIDPGPPVPKDDYSGFLGSK